MQEKGTRDNAADKSYGNGISMILGCGQKPSGEEVSISLRLPSRTTDRPDRGLSHSLLAGQGRVRYQEYTESTPEREKIKLSLCVCVCLCVCLSV
jgi:hypothetical protein